MNSKVWSVTSPEALGTISASQKPQDWGSLLQSYMKIKASDRPSLIDIFSPVSLHVNTERIEILWLPRKTMFGRKFYLVGFTDNSITNLRIVVYEIEDTLFSNVACIFLSRPSCTVFPKG